MLETYLEHLASYASRIFHTRVRVKFGLEHWQLERLEICLLEKMSNLAKGLQAAASDWWLCRWFVKWKTIRTGVTAKSCISNGINTCSRGNMQLKLFCLSLNRYGPSRRAWLMKLECLALLRMFNVCGKGRLRKWGTLYNLAMDELRTPRDVDIVQSVLQYLEEHEQRTHPAGTRFVIHDTLCMCTSSAAYHHGNIVVSHSFSSPQERRASRLLRYFCCVMPEGR